MSRLLIVLLLAVGLVACAPQRLDVPVYDDTGNKVTPTPTSRWGHLTCYSYGVVIYDDEVSDIYRYTDGSWRFTTSDGGEGIISGDCVFTEAP